jgi:ligand-binding sensor domain-containing protein
MKKIIALMLVFVIGSSMPVYGLSNRISKQYTRINSALIVDKVVEVYPFEEGIWFVTGGGGVATINEQNQWTTYQKALYGLSNNFVNCMTIDINGNVYFGTNSGVSVFKTDGQWDQYYMNNNSIYGETVTSLTADTEGGIWHGVTNYGAYHIDAQGNRTNYNTLNSEIPSTDVTKIVLDEQGGTWFATHPNYSDIGGIAYLDAEGEWTVYNSNNSELPSNRVNDLYIASDGTLWVGTINGLAAFKDGIWDIYNKRSIMDYFIKSIAEDQYGNIYAATWGDGLLKIDNTAMLVEYKAANTPIPNNYIYDVAVETDGTIWVSTNLGVTEIKEQLQEAPIIQKPDKVMVFLNGQNLRFDVEPVIRNGHTLVSMRNFLEALNQDVEWNEELQTVTSSGDKSIELVIGDQTTVVDGNMDEIEVAPEIIEGRTMVPLRWLAETLDYVVEWDPINYYIDIIK